MAYSGVGVVESDSQLQKLLADERLRSEKHKHHYQTLKDDYTKLQDEYRDLEREAARTMEDARDQQEGLRQQLETSRRTSSALQAEKADLLAQVLTPQKLEVIRLQVTEETEAAFQGKFATLEEQANAYRTEANKLRYEFSFLKSEYEKEKEMGRAVVEELRVTHDAEVAALRKDRELCARNGASEIEEEGLRLRNTQRENTQLNIKVKSLLGELQEVRAEKETLSLQADSLSRVQARQLSEHQAALRTLQTEKDSLRNQYERVQKDLMMCQQENISLEARIHELEREAVVLRGRAEDAEHQRKMEIAEMKMELVRQRGDLEREKDKIESRVSGLTSQLEVARAEAEKHDAACVELEQRSARRVQAAHEEDWQKIAALQNDKLELETKLQEMERRRIEAEGAGHADKEKAEERVRGAERAREEAEKETLVLKTQVAGARGVQEQLEHEQNTVSDLQSRLHRLELDLNVVTASERELTELSDRLKNELSQTKEETRRVQEHLSSRREETDHVLSQHRATWEVERTETSRRLQELEGELTALHGKHAAAAGDHKQKKRKYFKVMKALRNKTELLHARLQESKIEREALKHAVSSDSYNDLKKRYNDLLKRHREFRSLLLAQVEEVKIGDRSFASIHLPLDTTLQMVSFLDQERATEREVEELRERVSSLTTAQQQQLQQLDDIKLQQQQPHQQPLHA